MVSRYKLIQVPGQLIARAVSAISGYVPLGTKPHSDLTNIQELLDAEAEFAKQTPEVLKPFAPQLLEAFNDAMAMYTTFSRIIGQHSPATVERRLLDCFRRLGAANAEELKAIRDARSSATSEQERLLREAEALEDQLEAWMIRGVVLIQLARAFSWSVADMMRMRITTATGLQRLVVEGFALLCLMRDDAAIAIAWRKVVTEEDGIAFYRTYQRRIRAELEKCGLDSMYDRASGLAMHLRFAGAVHGLAFEKKDDALRRQTSTVMLYQELRPETAFSFIVGAVSILDTQARVFSGLASAFPETDEPTWTGSRVPAFSRTVQALWQRFRTAFPDKMADLERKHGPLLRRLPNA